MYIFHHTEHILKTHFNFQVRLMPCTHDQEVGRKIQISTAVHKKLYEGTKHQKNSHMISEHMIFV